MSDVNDATPKWPHRPQRVKYGYAIWRDVFEDEMKCGLEEATSARRVATFVCVSDPIRLMAYMLNILL